MRLDKAVVVGRPTSEVVCHADSKSVFKGSGQECADFMYMKKGDGIFMRKIINN